MSDNLPTCRWRGEVLPSGCYPCRSPKLITGREGVPAAVCRQCPYRDHEPVPEERQEIVRRVECVHLGRVVDRLDCNCQMRWLRQCELHQLTSLQACQSCPDYEPDR